MVLFQGLFVDGDNRKNNGSSGPVEGRFPHGQRDPVFPDIDKKLHAGVKFLP